MSAVVPYAASLHWYAVWLGERMAGKSDSEAVSAANRFCGIRGKAFARAAIGGHASPMLLNVAVEGGSSALKRMGAERRATISLHGRWPHVHLGALDAHYGRAPYYQHVMPGLREILESVAAADCLAEFNLLIHRWLSTFLCTEALSDGEGGGLPGEAVFVRGAEIIRDLDPELSVIDALMRHGPETTLALATMCKPK